MNLSCTNSCDRHYLCGQEHTYAVYNITKVEADSSVTDFILCLDYNRPIFKWEPCSGSSKQLICSDENRVAAVQAITGTWPMSWSVANTMCLDERKLPATIESIRTGKFVDNDNQPHWTGVIQAHTLLKAEHGRWALKKMFALITIDGKIDFEVDRPRHRLCLGVPPVPITVEQITPDTIPTVTVTKHQSADETSTAAIAIGITIGIILMIAGVVVIVLYKRGSIPCNKKTENGKHQEDKPELEENKSYEKSIEDNVPNHNYFILKKCEHYNKDNVEHYNEASEAYMDEDYTTIQETGEPFEKNDDYDYTTNALTSGFKARKQDNAYNKLKIGRSGDYDKVGIQGQDGANASGNDYDTTSAALTQGQDENSDYNHIPLAAYKAGGTSDDIKGNKDGDNDAVNSMRFKSAQSDSSDYTLVKKDRLK